MTQITNRKVMPTSLLSHTSRLASSRPAGFLGKRLGSLSAERWRALVNRRHPSLSVMRQCQLLDISRSTPYYQPVGISEKDLTLIIMIDRQYLATPFYGSR
jgi:hypothetical protein